MDDVTQNGIALTNTNLRQPETTPTKARDSGFRSRKYVSFLTFHSGQTRELKLCCGSH